MAKKKAKAKKVKKPQAKKVSGPIKKPRSAPKSQDGTRRILRSVFKRNSSVLFSEINQTVQIVHLDRISDLQIIDGLAKHVWLAFNGKSTVHDLIEQLKKSLKIPEHHFARFESDVVEFTQELKKRALLKS